MYDLKLRSYLIEFEMAGCNAGFPEIKVFGSNNITKGANSLKVGLVILLE
jgi:hypothetical protein